MIDLVVRHIIPTTMALLPSAMDTPRARAQMVAVGLQESKFLERQQVLKTGARTGPARGLWQFERAGGTRGVMTHDRSRALAERVLVELRYKHLVGNFREVHYTLRDNDVLAC
ncbi:MAG TPA: hypothetical protein VJ890_24770, partial [Vineibacter sp.]|nr:hypothetical protein [Vineibacter sp.]